MFDHQEVWQGNRKRGDAALSCLSSCLWRAKRLSRFSPYCSCPIIFLFGLVLPIVLALYVVPPSTFMPPRHRSGRVSQEVPVVFSLQRRAKTRVVPNSEKMNPVPGEDFLFFVWVKPSRTPTAEARFIPIVKFDVDGLHRQGYAIAFVRTQLGIRPEIYWKGESRKGGWYQFPELEVIPNVWSLLALSYRGDRLLGLHAVVRYDPEHGSIVSLGGHVVDGDAPPSASAPLTIGALKGDSSFRGQIGPFGIISGTELTESLLPLLKTLDASPGEAPSIPKSLRLQLLVTSESELVAEKSESLPR
jgi:hypothetical protein